MRSWYLIFLIFSLNACKSPAPATQNQPIVSKNEADTASGGSEKLFAHKWILTELDGKIISLTSNTDTAKLLFYPGQVSRVSGSTGCNQLNGTFELESGNRITFSPIAITKKMCPEASIPEQRFLHVLKNTNRFSVTDNELLLLQDNTVLAKFKAVNESTSVLYQPIKTNLKQINLNQILNEIVVGINSGYNKLAFT